MRTHSNTIKALVIGALALILLIPAALVQEVVDERSALAEEVQTELGEQWARPQTVVGPYVVVPYSYLSTETTSSGRKTSTRKTGYLHLLPATLDITSEVQPELRARGIFEAVVYQTDVHLSATFSQPNLASLGISAEDVRWDLASLNLGISDNRGLKDGSTLSWNGLALDLVSGVASDNIAEQGVHVPIHFDGALKAEAQLNLLGNQSLSFAPTGSTTRVSVKSPWDSPSFSGAFLPEQRDVSATGFSAQWSVNHLNRTYPEVLVEGDYQYEVAESALGVDLVQTVNHYQKSHRAGRYAILFIGLTFVAFFLMEVLNGLRIHPIQYALVGIALVLFYTLLLAFSEQIGFNPAYLTAATATTGLATAYSRAVLRSRTLSIGVGALLGALYLFLFVVIQLEDYALLVGSIGLFAIVGAVMYFSRNINWYGETPEQPN